jgi:hypoxanthine phosphoribosyltransferase
MAAAPEEMQSILGLNIDETTSSIIAIGYYFPVKGPTLEIAKKDQWTKDILILKGADKFKEQDTVIDPLAQFIASVILDPNIVVMAVPSSTADNQDHGATKLAAAVSDKISGVCGNAWLTRMKTVASAHGGGSRNPQTHEDSINVNAEHVSGKNILLIDDVVTTGTIIAVCRTKLIAAGARKVVCLTLGRTVNMAYKNEDLPMHILCKDLSNTPLANNQVLAYNNKLAISYYENEEKSDQQEIIKSSSKKLGRGL